MTHADERGERFERAFRAHIGAVRAYSARRSPHHADDVVAETFEIAWRRLDDAPDVGLPWLLAIARRVLANRVRNDRRQIALAERVAHERAADQEAPFVDEGVSPRLATALRRLRPADREILLLEAWDGLDRGGIATVLGVSAPQVRLRLHRARKRFADEFAKDAPAATFRLEEVN